VVRAGFRVFNSPDDLGSSWLASPPSVVSVPRPSGLRPSEASGLSQQPKPSSPALHRHLGVFTSHAPPRYSRPTSTVSRFPKAPRGSFLALQHLNLRNPSFHSPSPKSVRSALPCAPEGTSSGLATRSTCASVPQASKASFSPQRSWALPSRAFLLSGDRSNVPARLSAPALPYETSRPRTGASAASSHLKSRVPSRSQGL